MAIPPLRYWKAITMKHLDKFAFAGMVSCSSPSNNKVGYFSPTVIHTEIEAGQISVQSTVDVRENACLCSNNKGFLVGVVNPNSGHLHPGTITVEPHAWIGHIGDKNGVVMHLGKDADGTLILNGGRALFAKGDILGNGEVISRIEINDGALEAKNITFKNPHSSIRIRHGGLKTGNIDGGFKIWVYGGILLVQGHLHAGSVSLTGMGALLLEGQEKLDASLVGGAGLNFVGDGGAVIVPIHSNEGTLSQTYEAEAFFDELMKRGKIWRDGKPVSNFSNFHMEKLIGKKGKSYAALKPHTPQGGKYQAVAETLRTLLYGNTKPTYDL